MPIDQADVRHFYDRNTRLFLRWGQGGDGTIHRAVWGPGVDSRVQAMAYVEQLVLERLRSLTPAFGDVYRVADLGAGVCASLCRIAAQAPVQGVGITISPAQVRLAAHLIRERGAEHAVRCVQGDFCHLPPGLDRVDLAYAIESYVHAPDAAAFFGESAGLVRPGGLLVVCDDFLGESTPTDAARAASWTARFREGWRAPNLITLESADALAREAGFRRVDAIDLTRFIELGRPRDHAIALLMRLAGWLPIRASYWGMLRGGDALQRCLRRGWITHRLVVWQRSA